MDDAQRASSAAVFAGINNAGLLDFVAAWYVKAARYAKSTVHPELAARFSVPTPLRVAFVSTNSITQGEQVGVLWSWLLAQGMHIQFAHRTFRWSNEASGKAAVHCVIIGFGEADLAVKTIYEYEDIAGKPHAIAASNINPYLVDASNVVLPRRREPICDVPEIGIGNKPIDDGNYLFTTAERDEFLKLEPAAAKWFRRWLGAEEFLNGFERWCLWLGDCPPSELRALPNAMKRVQSVKLFRQKSKSLPTQKLANTPTRFHVENIPGKPYLLIPRVSSERRLFIPMGYIDAQTMTSDSTHMVTDASPYHFGILSSTMHMAWVRTTCGRLESRYRYSKDIVYNNYPWPSFKASATEPLAKKAKTVIETAAQAVLDARAQFPGSSLADLYDPLTMPPALVKAHQKLDAAVDAAYAQDTLHPGKKTYASDAERVAYLFELYQRLTSLLPTAAPQKPPRKKATP
jgi:hypothetical protein